MFPGDESLPEQVLWRDGFLYSPAESLINFELPTVTESEDACSDLVNINCDDLIGDINLNKCDFNFSDFNFNELDIGIDYCLLEALNSDRSNDTPFTSDVSDTEDVSNMLSTLNLIVPQEADIFVKRKGRGRSILNEKAGMLLRIFGKPKYCVEQEAFMCPVKDCGRLYAKASLLRAHLLRHSGEKPFECNWNGCPWRFARSDELARHKRSHSGEKPYKCKECDKRFARSDHLAKHGKVHARRAAAAAAATNKCAKARTQRSRRLI